jgi:hypothetical protein
MSRQPWSAVLGTAGLLIVCSGAFGAVRISLEMLGHLRPSLLPAVALATLVASVFGTILIMWHLARVGRLLAVRIAVLCGRPPERIARRLRLSRDAVRMLSCRRGGKRDHLGQAGFSGLTTPVPSSGLVNRRRRTLSH